MSISLPPVPGTSNLTSQSQPGAVVASVGSPVRHALIPLGPGGAQLAQSGQGIWGRVHATRHAKSRLLSSTRSSRAPSPFHLGSVFNPSQRQEVARQLFAYVISQGLEESHLHSKGAFLEWVEQNFSLLPKGDQAELTISIPHARRGGEVLDVVFSLPATPELRLLLGAPPMRPGDEHYYAKLPRKLAPPCKQVGPVSPPSDVLARLPREVSPHPILVGRAETQTPAAAQRWLTPTDLRILKGWSQGDENAAIARRIKAAAGADNKRESDDISEDVGLLFFKLGLDEEGKQRDGFPGKRQALAVQVAIREGWIPRVKAARAFSDLSPRHRLGALLFWQHKSYADIGAALSGTGKQKNRRGLSPTMGMKLAWEAMKSLGAKNQTHGMAILESVLFPIADDEHAPAPILLGSPRVSRLAEKEREVADHLVKGVRGRELAEALEHEGDGSSRTSGVLRRLCLDSVCQLAILMVAEGRLALPLTTPASRRLANEGLLPWERYLLAAFGAGRNKAEMAHTLDCSLYALESKLLRLRKKVGVGSEVELTLFALAHGFAELPDLEGSPPALAFPDGRPHALTLRPQGLDALIWRLTERQLFYGQKITRGGDDQEMCQAYDLEPPETDPSSTLRDLFNKVGASNRAAAAAGMAAAGLSEASESLQHAPRVKELSDKSVTALRLAADGVPEPAMTEYLAADDAAYHLSKARDALGTVSVRNGFQGVTHLAALAVELGIVTEVRKHRASYGVRQLKTPDQDQGRAVPRTVEVVERMARGMSPKEMAEDLGITAHGVHSARTFAFRGVDVDEDWQLALRALEEGVIGLPELTDHQREVLSVPNPRWGRMVKGLGLAEPLAVIATDIGIPLRVLRAHLVNLKAHARVRNEVQLALLARAAGLIRGASPQHSPLDVVA